MSNILKKYFRTVFFVVTLGTLFGLKLFLNPNLVLADDWRLVAPAERQGVVEMKCEWGEDEHDPDCNRNRCGVTDACYRQDDDWNCIGTHRGCAYGGGSVSFYWDGVSNVWISGRPFDSLFTSAMLKGRPQDGRMTCEDIPLAFGGGGRCGINNNPGLWGSTLIDDRGIYTLNGFTWNLFYDYGMPSEGHGNPGETGGACDAVSAHAAMRLNDGQLLKFYNNPTPQGWYANPPLGPSTPPPPQITIPPGTLKVGMNTISVSYKDVCGQEFRSETPIYVVTDGSFNPSVIPNCSNISGPTTLTLGQTGTYRADFYSPGAPGSLRGVIDYDSFNELKNVLFPGQTGSIPDAKFTPTAAGTYTVWCRAWNDGIAECRDAPYVDHPPRFACAGPGTHMTVTVTPPVMMDMTIGAFEDRLNTNGCKDSGELAIGSSWPEAANLSLIVKDATTGVVKKTITPTLVGGVYKFLGVEVGQAISLSAASNSVPSGYSTYTGYDNGGTGRCGASPVLISNQSFPTILAGFTQNISWLRAYNGDVYARNSYKISVPPNGPGLIDNYLINGNAGGTALVGPGGSIVTYLTTLPNRTSINRWEVNNYPGGINYFNRLPFGPVYPNVTDWNNLKVNTSYNFPGNALPSRYRFNTATPGVAIVYASSPLTINGDFKNQRGTPFNSSQGVIIMNTDEIKINPSNSGGKDEVDAVLISKDTIEAVDTNPSNQLEIYGALYAKNGLNLPRKLLNNNVDAAINVHFQLIYLLTTSVDLIKPSISNWRELSPQ